MSLEEIIDTERIDNERIDNLTQIAYDELESKQFEEAAKHFDQIYMKNSSDYVAYFLRAYCKSRCCRKENPKVEYDDQARWDEYVKLSNAFQFAVKKILTGKDLDEKLSLVVSYYIDGCEWINRIDHPYDKSMSVGENSLLEFITENIEIVKENNKLKGIVVQFIKDNDYSISYTKSYGGKLFKSQELIYKLGVELIPSYEANINEAAQKMKDEAEAKRIYADQETASNGVRIVIGIVIVIAIIALLLFLTVKCQEAGIY